MAAREWVARAGAASGAVYVVVAVVATGGAGDPNAPNLGDSGDRIAAYYAGRYAFGAKFYAEILVLVALVFFAAALWGVLRRAEPAPAWLSTAGLSAAVAAVIVKLASLSGVFALGFHSQPIEAQLARALFEMNWFAFILTWPLQAGLLLAVFGLSMLYRSLPLWLGIPAGLIAAALLVGAAIAVTGFTPFPELAWLLWVLVTSIYLTIRYPGPVTARAEPQPAVPR